ncbi:hypothetical protein J2P12_00025 [Candidatus Bathyarchaeota archaeon]|nr:hypothetical protein [Candidatus Bathyarchaeota archaeon]
MNKKIPIRHPEWLKSSDPGRYLDLYHHGVMPDAFAGWILVVSLKHPLRAIYGSDLRAAWELLKAAIYDKIKNKWDDFWYKFDLLSKQEREIKQQVFDEEIMGRNYEIRVEEFHEEQEAIERMKRNGRKLYRNFYRCEGNHEYREQHEPLEWNMVWDCTCNDKCPECWVEMEPWKSVEIRGAFSAREVTDE